MSARRSRLRPWAPVMVAFFTVAVAGLFAAPQTAPPRGGQAPARKYTGAPVDIDVQGADLRAVLRSLAEMSGLNMVLDPSIKGSVDLKLSAVPWDQAFEMVLKTNKLGYVLDDSVVRVVPVAALAEERKQEDERALSGPIELHTFMLNYAEASKLAPLLTKAVLSSRGQIQVDDRTNQLIVSEIPGNIAAIADLIKSLDRAQPQVEIEGRIVEVDRNAARALGIEWGMNGRMTPALGNTTGLAFPNSVAANGAATALGAQPPTGVKLPVIGATSGIGLAMGSVGGAFNLDVALTAIESAGKGRILSKPHVVTQNNREAVVTQGFEVPIQTVSNNTVSVTFKNAALTLTVTPQITTDNAVLLHVQIENSFPDFSKAVNGNPSINTQRAMTQVQVDDGVTTVIGGILSSRETSSTDSTPGLSKIPLLGWLFKRNASSLDAEELLIFITPRIIRSHP